MDLYFFASLVSKFAAYHHATSFVWPLCEHNWAWEFGIVLIIPRTAGAPPGCQWGVLGGRSRKKALLLLVGACYDLGPYFDCLNYLLLCLNFRRHWRGKCCLATQNSQMAFATPVASEVKA